MVQARWIAVTMYTGVLLVLPTVGVLVKPPAPVPEAALRLLAALLGLVAVGEYLASLLVAARLTSGSGASRPVGALAAGIISAAMGASIAVYGFVLGLLGAPGWAPVFYVLCLVHGVHLAIRWPELERAAEQGAPG